MTKSPAYALRLNNIAAGYGPRRIIHDANLAVAPGSLVAVHGPNGAGKTTLLRVVLGLIVPEAGTVEMFGQTMTGQVHRRHGRKRIGYVPQERVVGALPITVTDAVLLGRWGRTYSALKRPGAADRDAVRTWVHRVGLGQKAHDDVRSLSGGQQQRVAIARALVSSPDLLILDEPTTHLDAEAKRQVIDLIIALHNDFALTTLLVTHDSDILRTKELTLYRMDEGKLTAQHRNGAGLHV